MHHIHVIMQKCRVRKQFKTDISIQLKRGDTGDVLRGDCFTTSLTRPSDSLCNAFSSAPQSYNPIKFSKVNLSLHQAKGRHSFPNALVTTLKMRHCRSIEN